MININIKNIHLLINGFTKAVYFGFAGRMSDPRDIPGLAHLCEHMLFVGTEKVRLWVCSISGVKSV